MSDFKAKMHQNRFRRGLRPGPRSGSIQHSPDPVAAFKWAYTSKGRGRMGTEEGGMGREDWEGWELSLIHI